MNFAVSRCISHLEVVSYESDGTAYTSIPTGILKDYLSFAKLLVETARSSFEVVVTAIYIQPNEV